MNLVKSFGEIAVSFRNDGFLNATQIAKHFGKRVPDFLKTEQNQEYISALAEHLSKTLKIVLDKNQLVIVKHGGNQNGTWLHPKLAIHFARWLDPRFAVWCDEQIEQILGGRLKTESRTTSDERTALRQAVSALVGLRRVDYSTAYNMVHQRFGVEAIEDIPRESLPDAVRYVHALTLDNALTGEVLEKIERPSEKQFSADEIHAIGVCAKYLADCSEFLYPLSDALRGVGSRFSGRAFSLAQEPHFWLDTVQRALARVNGSAVRGL
ncbi:KilA-N domain [Kingella potus]|uniref:KilA-N domain n=1 Tax=Kingella potus TaxID=265175 RepID=A0A377R3F3_9NEIS|nr:KilA-N domain [Kingella potus]